LACDMFFSSVRAGSTQILNDPGVLLRPLARPATFFFFGAFSLFPTPCIATTRSSSCPFPLFAIRWTPFHHRVWVFGGSSCLLHIGVDCLFSPHVTKYALSGWIASIRPPLRSCLVLAPGTVLSESTGSTPGRGLPMFFTQRRPPHRFLMTDAVTCWGFFGGPSPTVWFRWLQF